MIDQKNSWVAQDERKKIPRILSDDFYDAENTNIIDRLSKT